MFFLIWRYQVRLEHYRNMKGPFGGGTYSLISLMIASAMRGIVPVIAGVACRIMGCYIAHGLTFRLLYAQDTMLEVDSLLLNTGARSSANTLPFA